MDKKEFNKKFSSNLKRVMSEHGKTQSDIAHDLNFSKQIVSMWVNGQRCPRAKTISLLAAYLHVEASELMGDSINMPNEEISSRKKDLISAVSDLSENEAALLLAALKSLLQK